MKSTTQRAFRILPIAAISAIAILIGTFASTNISSASNPITSTSTTIEVIVESEAVPPVIDDVSPKHGPSSGGTLITFTGKDLDGITSITVGGAECKPITVVSPEEITCITSSHVPGPVDVILKSGSGTTELYNAFTYDPALPLPPSTGDDILAPSTGMLLLGSSSSITLYDIILICFLIILIIGFTIFKMCIIPKKNRKKPNKTAKNAQKSATHKKTTKRKS